MTKSQANASFLENTNQNLVASILKSIADDYGTTTDAIRDELLGESPEYAFEYISDAHMQAITHMIFLQGGLMLN